SSFSLTLRLPPSSPLFPYTTLFRSPNRRRRFVLFALEELLDHLSRLVERPGLVLLLAGLVRLLAGLALLLVLGDLVLGGLVLLQDRKSTRLNSSHVSISYAVFCLKK